MLEKFGYQPARYEFMMKRLIDDPLPPAPMPAGLEVRPVLKEHIRQIWDAGDEAFKDHWGYVPSTELNYQDWMGWRGFQPDLWKVAWDGDQIAGMVLNFIDNPENKEYRSPSRLHGRYQCSPAVAQKRVGPLPSRPKYLHVQGYGYDRNCTGS